MSYYKYIVPLYGSSNPRLNRTLRSSSVERRVSSTSSSSATCNCGCAASRRAQRAASVGPTSFEYVSKDYSLLPHTRSLRASSLEPVDTYSRAFYSSYATRYQDYDRKVLNYAHKLDMEETTRELMNLSRPYRSYNSSPKPFSSNYDYYSSRKFDRDYLYNSNDVYSTYKHYRISNSTLSDRNQRAKSPLLTREIDRYYKPRPNYIGDVNPGPSQAFRHYNYRHIPYFGGSDYYQMMRPRRHI